MKRNKQNENDNIIALAERRTQQLSNTIEYLQERITELELSKEDEGWISIGNQNRDVEFSLQHLHKVVARSRLFFIANPLINRAVSLQCDYVFAQGINIQATNDLVNQVIQNFLSDRMNRREFTGHQARLMKEQTLMIDGNVFLVLFTDKLGTGKVQIRSVIVEEITDIITNPDDANEVWFYQREWTTYVGNEYKQNKVLYPDIDYTPTNKPTSRNGVPILWDAPIYHIKVGGLSKSRYGVPETYSALDWANAHRRMLEDWATIVKAYAMFAFKLTVSGNQRSIAAATTKLGTTVTSDSGRERNPTPLTASMFTRTKDGADIEPIKTAGATTNASDARELMMMVAAAMGLPMTFFGDVDTGNLATAKTLDRPTELKFRSRQQLWTDVIHDILDYVLYWSALAPKGLLKGKVKFTRDVDGKLIYDVKKKPDTTNVDIGTTSKEEMDLHVEVVFPPILEHSILDRITAIADAVTLNGKAFAFHSPELIKLTIRLMFQALGLNNVDELVDQVFAGISLDDPKDSATNDKPGPPGPSKGLSTQRSNPKPGATVTKDTTNEGMD